MLSQINCLNKDKNGANGTNEACFCSSKKIKIDDCFVVVTKFITLTCTRKTRTDDDDNDDDDEDGDEDGDDEKSNVDMTT